MKNRNIGPLLFALLLLVSSVLACKGLGGSSSPTATYKAFFEAQKRKDVPGMKKTLSKGSLAMLEQGAEQQKKTLDESLKEGFDDLRLISLEVGSTGLSLQRLRLSRGILECQSRCTDCSPEFF